MGAPPADQPASAPQRGVPLQALFEPRSIAVVGASTITEKAGYQMLATLRGFPGRLAAVNPSADRKSVGGLGVPVYAAPERAARAARALAADCRARFRVQARRRRPAVPAGRRLDRAAMDEDTAKTLLARWGVPVPERRVCTTRVDAHAALADLGGPLVAKVLDAAIAHKSDVGGVHAGIEDVAALDSALDAIDRAGTVRVTPDGPLALDALVVLR
ncbi:MAG: hypothetical protein GEU81_11065 [Nitriliruptorales bacterium]|nr:hypothetical protein [Nitriliruptorales bacterium]